MRAINYANRGMGLETLIEYANQQYASKGIAVVTKIATPWKVVRSGKKIISAFPEKKSTVDFIGNYQGKAIAFDVKETERKTLFPMANIEQHQIDFMQKWESGGGIAFVIIEFKAHKCIFRVPFAYIESAVRSGAKSLPYEYLHQCRNVYVLEQGEGIVLDYLKHLKVGENHEG